MPNGKPVQYVKICSLYGAGFYYIPGTDTCLKIGGWVRQYLGVNANGNLTNGDLGLGQRQHPGEQQRLELEGAWLHHGRCPHADRVRHVAQLHRRRWQHARFSRATASFSSNRAFIQLAGFTFGVAQSFYDLYPTPALSYFGGMINPSSDTGDGGQTVSAYTAQFGNGLSATLSLEAPRTTNVIRIRAASFATGGATIATTRAGASPLSGRRGQPAYGRLMGRRPDHGWYP